MKEKLQKFSGVTTSPDHPTVFVANQSSLPTPHVAQILSKMEYFPNHGQFNADFFTSKIGPDVLMKVFED